MRRRTFCASGLTALVSASLPYGRVLAAADDVAVMGLGGAPRVLKSTDIDDFRASLRGQLLMPGENGYESARKIWNGAFDRKPALTARCAGAGDVIARGQLSRGPTSCWPRCAAAAIAFRVSPSATAGS